MHLSRHSVVSPFLIWTLLVLCVRGLPPSITVWPPNPHYVVIDSTWTDPGVDCQDPEEGYVDVVMTPAYVDTSAVGTFILTYTCSDTIEYPWNTVKTTRTVVVRKPPTIDIAGGSVLAISNGAFGPIKNSFCTSAISGDQQSAGLVTLDTINTAFSPERQAKCLSLCRHYQSANAQNGKGCELRVSGASNPGCYVHTQTIATDGVDTANYYCWKAEFNDPGACCADQDGAALTVMQTSRPLTNLPGSFQMFYWCEDPFMEAQVSITRDLIIDEPPQLFMHGEQATQVTRGGAYTDAGVWCHDAEDGPIIEVPLGGYSELRIATTTTSGFNTETSNYFATSDDKTTGGAYTGSGTGCNECHNTTADSSGVHWIRLDLGHVRTVYRVSMEKMVGNWTIRVGTSEVRDRNPTCGKTENAAGSQVINCVTLLAGRFVYIESNDARPYLVICEVTLDGQPGPPPPSTFDIVSGCSVLQGTWVLSGTVEGWPSWKNDDQDGSLVYENTGFVFKKGGIVYSRASEGAALPAAAWEAVRGGCQPRLKFIPTDACPWLFGFSSTNNLYRCADWSEQETIESCVARGGLAQCPPNKPQACALLDSDPENLDGCSTDCSSAGGFRSCGLNSKTGMAKSISFFTGSWEGTKNDVQGSYGIAFIPKTNMFVTHLGRHEGLGYELQVTADVTLWSTVTQQALASLSVGPGSEQDGNYRVEAITEPVMLNGGTEYRLTQFVWWGIQDKWNDATEQPENMWATTEWRYVDFIGGVSPAWDSRRRGGGYPMTVDSPLQRAGMVNFKYYIPAARIEQVGKVNTKHAGITNLVFMCMDTMGQRATAVRTIKVGCEGPNPPGIYGGNKVVCELTIDVESKADFYECRDWCLSDDNCEAAEFMTDTSDCSRLKRCTGKYERDENIYRQCGFCKIVDNPPVVVLGPAAETVNKGGSWTPGTVSCKDNEDQVPPTSVQMTTLSTETPGVFEVEFGCTDSAGQTTVGKYEVTVKDDCTTAHFSDPNMFEDGPCAGRTGTSLTFKHGETCNARCGPGWVAVDEELVCTSKDRYDYESAFEMHPSLDDPDVMKDYECGEMPCDAPPVANVKTDEKGVPMSCKGGHRIVNDGFCEPNCLDGYIPVGRMDIANDRIPTITEPLECDLGTFIPDMFYCKLPAAPPTLIGFGKPEVLHLPVYWQAGTPNDCVFKHWRVEARQILPGFEETEIINGSQYWHEVPGCGAVNHTKRDTVACHGYYKVEGATYEWRVKEECKYNDDMNSEWLVSAPVKMRIVIPPEVLFQIPSGDVTFDPVQLMIAFTVPITVTQHVRFGRCILCQLLSPDVPIRVNISRTGTWCVDSSGGFGGVDIYETRSSAIVETGGVGDYVRLTGGRIAIIKPPDKWLQPGCDFNVTLDIGAMQTVDTPAKPTPWVQFNFTHIDLAPEFKQFILGQTTTVSVEFKIFWNLITVCNCTLIPTKEKCQENWDPNDPGCVRYVLPIKEQTMNTGNVDYFVMGLYPGTEYRTACDGYKFGKPWIPIEPIPELRYDEVTFETLPDTDATVKYFYLNVTAVCDPVSNPEVGIHLPERYKPVMPPQFPLGYTVQILDWRKKCVGGRQMLHDETARITIAATVAANSIFAVVRWVAEPQENDVLQTEHHFDYTKDIHVNADPIVFTFRFEICPLAAILVPDGPVKCTDYRITVQCVDISFRFDSFVLDPNIDGSDYTYNYGYRRLEDSSEEQALRELVNSFGQDGLNISRARDSAQSWLSPGLMEKLQGFVAPAPESFNHSEQAASLLKSLFSIMENARQEVQSGAAESLEAALRRLLRSAPGRSLAETHFTVDVGMGAILQCNVDRAVFDWMTTTVHLGPIYGVDGFRQFVTLTGEPDSTEPMALVLAGQGTRLPVVLQWEAVTFPTPFSVSFTAPNLTVPAYEAPIHVTSILKVNLGNVPDVTALFNKTDPQVHVSGDTTTGYGSPESHIQLGVYKDGRSENLCGPLFWPDVDDWTNAQCNLLPAALVNITVVIRLKDYLDGEFYIVNSTLSRDQVTYRLPTHTGLKDAGDWALNNDNTIDLAAVSARPVAELYPQGDKLPSLAVVQLGGATLPGYEMRIQGDAEIQLCQKIEWMNASALLCVLAKCINVTGLGETPALRMYIGDLTTNSPVPGLLKVPRPIVDSYEPTIIDDVGRNRTIQIWGKHFGERSCQETHVDATQFLGSPTGAHITVGEWEAPCKIVFQNNTYIECMISAPVSDPLDLTYVGTEHPPARRTSLQTFTFRKGNYLKAKNMDQLEGRRGGRRLEEDEEGYNEEDNEEWLQRQLQRAQSKYIKLEFTVRLMDCPPGWRRKHLRLDECEPCRPGRFNTLVSEAWPLRCEVCPEARYSDEEGSISCKDCPENTFAAQPASSIEACLCKPGHYSQHFNTSTLRTNPGTPCLSCSSQIMTDEPLPRKENCGGSLAIATYCDVYAEPCCAPEKVGVMYYRVCKAYCAGGTAWPVPKWTFSELENRQISGPGAEAQGASQEGPPLFEPQLARCDPPIACMNAGVCHVRYTGYGCGECVFGYYRDKYSKECVPCGDEQVVGMIIMSAAMVMMSVGGLFFSSSFMRLKSDIVFEHEMKLAAKEFILEPLLKSKGVGALCNSREKRRLVVVHKWDVGSSFRYSQTGHLGIVFRVNAKGVIHVAGFLPQSPMESKVKQGWKLLSVNGVRPKAKSENEVHGFIRNSKFPLRFVFRCPRAGTGTGEVEGLDNDRKLIVMLMGVMNAFNQISMFDFEWPPMFRYLAALAAQFSFSFNFFHPECSVPTPFNTKWKGFLMIPYGMLMPLTTAYIIVRLTAFPRGLKGIPLKTREWMLRNAFARTVCMAIIALLPFHLEQLLVPFACVERAEGTYFVSATPDTICSFKDPRYGEMLFIASCGGGAMLGFYSLLLIMLYKSFNWQFGLKIRDKIPFYAGMVEVSVFGQLGYVEEVRWRVMTNVVCANLFDPTIPLLRIRERLEWASVYQYPRSRKGYQEKMGKLFEEAGVKRKKRPEQEVQKQEEKDDEDEAEAGIADEDTAAGERSRLKKGVRRWRKSKFTSPEKKTGNVITYGWILIVNLFWRQLISLITIKMSEGNLVVVGAAMLMLVHGGNVTMLIIFKPYKSLKVANIEATMLAALFMVLWCAVIKDLLSNHINAHLFQDTLVKVNNGIDALALILMTLVVVMPGQALHEMFSKIFGAIQSRDSLLNEIYMVQTMRIERDAMDKRKARMEAEAEEIGNEGGLVVPPDIAKRFNGIRDAVNRINDSTIHPTPEQRRRFVHFIQIIRALPEDEIPRAKLKGAIKGVIEENTAAHAFHDIVEEHEAEAEFDEAALGKALPCQKGHPLLEWATNSDEWWCCECRATCLQGTRVHRCFKCNYHLCPKCVWNFKVGGKCRNGHIMVQHKLLPFTPTYYVCLGCEGFGQGNRWTCEKCSGDDYCFNCRPEDSPFCILEQNRVIFLDEDDVEESKKKGLFRRVGGIFAAKDKSKSSGPAIPAAKTEKSVQEESDKKKVVEAGSSSQKGQPTGKVGLIGSLFAKSSKKAQTKDGEPEAASSPLPPVPPPPPPPRGSSRGSVPVPRKSARGSVPPSPSPRGSKAAVGMWPARSHTDELDEDEIEIREPLQMEQAKTESDDDLHF